MPEPANACMKFRLAYTPNEDLLLTQFVLDTMIRHHVPCNGCVELSQRVSTGVASVNGTPAGSGIGSGVMAADLGPLMLQALRHTVSDDVMVLFRIIHVTRELLALP